jgi:hypothetical protein
VNVQGHSVLSVPDEFFGVRFNTAENSKASSRPWLPDASNSRLQGSCQPTSIPRKQMETLDYQDKKQTLFPHLYLNTLFIPDWQSYINNNDLIQRLLSTSLIRLRAGTIWYPTSLCFDWLSGSARSALY